MATKPKISLLLCFLTFSLVAFSGSTAASGLLHGFWQCSTQFSRPEGDYRLQATTQLLNTGKFVSKGTLYAFNALIGSEIPLAFNASGAWHKKDNAITGEVTEGNISTGFSFLDRIANLLEDEVKKQPKYTTQIATLNKKNLVLADGTHKPIECTKEQ
jgi:hypothetical protein